MAEQKTKPTDESIGTFLSKVPEDKRSDCKEIISLMKRITRSEPRMWGPGILGFGSYHYKYESGHEGDAPLVGLSPRKQNITIYLSAGFSEREKLMTKLGKHKTGKGCLYIKKLEDVDVKILQKLIEESVSFLKSTYKSAK